VLSGVALMVAKYLIDSGVAATGVWWAPWWYLWPLWTVRMAQFDRAPGALFLMLGAVTLPFFWIGLSMSVRRAMDAGRSPLLGLGFAVPGVNSSSCWCRRWHPRRYDRLLSRCCQRHVDDVPVLRGVRSRP